MLDYSYIPCGNLNHTDPTNQILGLSTIGTNILNGTRPHITRNQRKVLSAIESHTDTLCHHIIPHFTTSADQVVDLTLYALTGRMHNDSFIIVCQKQIASSTYYYIRCIFRAKNCSHLTSFLIGGILQEPRALGIDTKCVMLLQTIIPKIPHLSPFTFRFSLFTFHSYVIIFARSHLPPVFLKCSSSS